MGRRCFYLLFLSLLVTSAKADIFFPSLKSGYKSLREYDYFRARKIFFHYRETHAYLCELGLADIYSRFDNPFSRRDSAFAMYERIKLSHNRLSKQDVEKISVRYNITEAYYLSVIHRIDSIGFEVARQKNSIAGYEQFIMFFRDAAEQKSAFRNIEVLSYKEAVQENSSQAYTSFLRKFESSEEAASARQQLDAALFRETLERGSLQELYAFPEIYPGSAFVSASQDSLYARAVPLMTEKNLESFIRTYPKNKNVNRAWYELYLLGNDNSAAFYKKFIAKYPDYPLLKDVANELELAEKNFYPVQVNGKWGFIDDRGTLMIPPVYESVESFSEGLCVIQADGVFGYINKSGRMAIQARYDEAEPFTGGLASVKKGSQYFFVNRNGNHIPGSWEDASDFSEGLATVKKNGKFGYIDASGSQVIDAEYDNAGDFSNGYAVVEAEGKSSIISRNGEVVCKQSYDWIDDFRAGFARFQENESFGLLSLQGNVEIPAQYEMLEFLSDSFLLAARDEKCGIIHLGESLSPMLGYDFSGTPPQAANKQVVVSLKGKCGLVQQNGKILIPFEYSGLTFSGNGLYGFKKKLKWGLMDSTRRMVLKPTFDAIGSAQNGLVAAKQKKYWGLVNEDGKWIVQAHFDNLSLTGFGWECTRKSLKGLIDITGEVLLDAEMQEIKQVNSNLLRVTKNNLLAYYNVQSRQYIWKASGF